MTKKLLDKLFHMTYDIKATAENKNNKDVSSARLTIIDKAKRSYMVNYTREDIEDAFMEAVLHVYERCLADPQYAAKVSESSVTFAMRKIAQRAKFKDYGYNQRGTVPKGGRRPHIQNMYNSEGDNQIERMASDPITGEVIIGN